MPPRLNARRLLPTLLAAVLVAACAAEAAVPTTDTKADVRPVPTAAVILPVPSLPVAPTPTLPATGPGATPAPTLDPMAWMPTRPSLDRIAPLPISDPSPVVGPALDPPIVAKGRFEMDLYRNRDFVTEATKWYCVPAAMLTMINIMSKGADHAKATQTSLYRLARKLSTKTLVGKGAEPIGWARGLEQLGYGGFKVGIHRTRREAVQAAAMAIRMTGRPAGLLAWRGAHSWVMSGFRATRDPAATDGYIVTDVFIEDVWYPYVSSIWGPSEPPDTLVAVGDLKKDYLKWRRPTRRYPTMDGRFVTILPVPSKEP